MRAAFPSAPAEALDPRARKMLVFEILIVLGLSLGRSGVYAVVELLEKAAEGPLAGQTTTLNPVLDENPVFDLVYQLLGIFFSLLPVAIISGHENVKEYSADGAPSFCTTCVPLPSGTLAVSPSVCFTFAVNVFALTHIQGRTPILSKHMFLPLENISPEAPTVVAYFPFAHGERSHQKQ